MLMSDFGNQYDDIQYALHLYSVSQIEAEYLLAGLGRKFAQIKSLLEDAFYSSPPTGVR